MFFWEFPSFAFTSVYTRFTFTTERGWSNTHGVIGDALPMSLRRITFTLGAAAGGLLGTAFLPVTVALADTYDYTNYDFTSVGNEVVEDGGIRNFLVEVPPAAAGSIQGTQDFAVTDPSGDSLGTVNADVASTTDMFGNTNELIYVTADPNADSPPVGSIFDTYTLSSGFSTVYTEIPTAGGNEISYSLDSPFGDFTVPTSFDAIAQTDVVPVHGDGAFSGDTFVPSGAETIEGVNGIPPADYDVLGTQTFDVLNSSGTPIGAFTADFANSSDILGNTTEDLLVTSSTDDAPADGSVIDYFFSDGDDSNYNVYSDLVQSDGTDKITDTLHSLFGTSNFPTDFDAASGLSGALNGTSDLATGFSDNDFDITPDTTGTIVAVDGIQPEDIDVQGYQEFTWIDGTQTGTFDGDVAQSTIVFGDTTQEQIVVAQDLTGNAPAAGSVFEDYNYGNGLEQIYSDVAGAGAGGTNEITDTYVTPFGDFSFPDSYDASVNLTSDSYAASSTSVSDLLSGLDASSFADMFPHLDAALNLLTSLF